jgi:small subunit ribosomal protein S17
MGAPEPSSPNGRAPSRRRRVIGRVVSDKMDKTVVVEVTRFRRDAMYKKYIRSRKRFKAHDEKDEYRMGDRVELVEYRPVSKTKRWKVVRLLDRPAKELVEKAPEGEGLP